MSSTVKQDDALVKIRFIGKKLNENSLPIYELGNTFIALQRIINKTYLFENNRLQKGFHLSWEDREKLSLQISEHTKESDGYGLIPFTTDPFIIGLLSGIVVEAFKAIAKYAYKKVIPNRKEDVLENQPLIGAIYNEISTINDRVGNIGGVNSIQISGNQNLNIGTIIFNSETRDYTRKLKSEPFLGEVTIIKGVVTRLYPQSNRINIRDTPGHYVRVFLEELEFNKIRYSKSKGLLVKITGRPIYRLGVETRKFEEFDAMNIVILRRKNR